jgi:adenosylmethionine-8-amino-7-oxononanoate aminotransferase
VHQRVVFEAFLSQDPGDALMHGPTFMANPLACAAANASLDLFEREPRVAQARAMQTVLAEGLAPCRSLPGVVDVRALGAIGVVQLSAPVDRVRLSAALVAAGVWVRPFGDIVYLTPALSMPRHEVEQLCAAIVAVLGG